MHLIGFAGKWKSSHSEADLASYVRATAAAGAGSSQRVVAPELAVRGNVTVALQGAPVWLQGTSSAASAAERILEEYLARGPQMLEGLHGAFAVAIVDGKHDRVVLALDRMGIERLCYALVGETIVFSSSCESVARFPLVKASVRPQALFDYLLLHMIPAPHTVYEGVHKLRPGTRLVFERGQSRIERFWSPTFVERLDVPETTLEAQLLDALKTGVERCSPDARTGAFLSGGLDSSSVAGMLATVTKDRPATTFSIGFGVDAYNELDFARVAAKRFKLNSHEYQVTADDIVAAFPLIAATYDEPFGNSSAVPTYFCAKVAAEHGVTHLLAGDGGDEIFGGNERYARQRVFERYQGLPGVLRGVIEPLSGLLSSDSSITAVRKLRSYVDQAKIPMPERLEYWNYMYRADLADMLTPEFRASTNPQAVFGVMQEVYDGVGKDATLLNHMLHYDWHFTLSDNDLRKVGSMCKLAGVRVSYPMLDPAMIDLSLRIPSEVKMRGGELRSFYKRAMRNFLPDEILNKTKHGFGLPFGVWLHSHAPLRDMILSLLSDLKARGIVNAKFLDSLIDEQNSDHPQYSGYAVWDLAMLEAWMQRHTDAASR
jgi:asparagine synthase (glutamine-hydrolysing)